MIRNLVARFTMVSLAAVACRPESEAVARKDDAAATIEQSRALAKDLAMSSQNYQRVRFVSDIEKVRVPKPVTNPEPEEVVKKGTDSVQVEPMVVPEDVTQPEAPPVTAPDSTTVTADAPRVPSIIPRDAPLPEAVASGPRRGPSSGPDPGDVVGVVIRGGGSLDPGHCPRHRPPGGPTVIPRIPRR